jgi:anti-sigma factor RsiW
VELQMSHAQVKALFPALVDEELGRREETELRAHLDGCAECRQGWDRYERAVSLVRKVNREKAPASLASAILRRVRRRKSHLFRRAQALQLAYRVPVEVVIPILVAAMIAALFLLGS